MHPQIVQELQNQIVSLEAMSDAVERTETAARLTLAASVMRKAIHVLTAPVLDDDVPFFLRKQAE
jgi:hypothetical protein